MATPQRVEKQEEVPQLRIIHGHVAPRETPAPLPREFACGEMAMPRWEEHRKEPRMK